MIKSEKLAEVTHQKPGIMDSLFTTSGSIIIGSVIISISILISGGVIKIKGLTPTTSAATPSLAAQAPAQPTQPTAPQAPPTKGTTSLGHLPIKGDKNAKVAVVEYADFRCPFCERFFQQTEPSILKDYVDSGKVQLAFRHFQFLGPASVTAGNASECANEQGKFWEYHDYLYKNQPDESDTSMFNMDKLSSIATDLGLNASQFKSCLSTTKFEKEVSADKADGEKVGVSGTPSFIIGKIGADGNVTGDLIVGAQPYSAIKAAIDQQLQ